MKKIIQIFLILLAVLFLTGCTWDTSTFRYYENYATASKLYQPVDPSPKSRPTLEDLRQLRDEMSPYEVLCIMGNPHGIKQSEQILVWVWYLEEEPFFAALSFRADQELDENAPDLAKQLWDHGKLKNTFLHWGSAYEYSWFGSRQTTSQVPTDTGSQAPEESETKYEVPEKIPDGLSLEEMEDFVFDPSGSYTPTLEDVAKLKQDMSLREIISILGKPTYNKPIYGLSWIPSLKLSWKMAEDSNISLSLWIRIPSEKRGLLPYYYQGLWEYGCLED